jgi:hypothetical protein
MKCFFVLKKSLKSQVCRLRQRQVQVLNFFTSTKVQILTQKLGPGPSSPLSGLVKEDALNPKFTCFTSTKVQILTLTRLPGASSPLSGLAKMDASTIVRILTQEHKRLLVQKFQY